MRPLLFLFFVALGFNVYSQSTITTYILLRHAEKGDDGTKDPDLSPAGKMRAEALVKTLAKQKIDAIYSTPLKRTRNTVAPLGAAKGLTVQDYNAANLAEVINVSQKFKGGTVVICGHSNTTPALLNLIAGKNDEFKTFDDADYANLIIVSVANGIPPKITWLTY
jgi:2,3-bisphosphoglycerate-dependent phosphoglycerate mutase